jgi:hypothetical protein
MAQTKEVEFRDALVRLVREVPPELARDVGQIAYLLLLLGPRLQPLPDELAGVFGEWSLRLGATPDMNKLVEFYAAHPPADAAVSRARAVFGGLLEGRFGGDARDRARQLLGQESARTPVGVGPVPEGSVKASPLARFAPPPPTSKEK